MKSARPWTADEWESIVWHAKNVRHPTPHQVLGLTARGSAQKSVQRLRELATQTEIRGVPGSTRS